MWIKAAVFVALSLAVKADVLFDTLNSVPFSHGIVGVTVSNDTYGRMPVDCYYLEAVGPRLSTPSSNGPRRCQRQRAARL